VIVDNRLAGRHILITGAGGGIGRSLAQGVACRGARVFAADLSEQAARETAAVVEGAGWCQVDVRDPESVAAMLARAEGKGDGVDGLVNCHGLSNYVPFLEMSLAEWQRLIDVNLTGTFIVGQAVARRMVDQGIRGAIVNISSTLGWVGAPERVHYLASKGGVNMLTRGMALDLAPYGIRVNAVGPGPVVTEMTRPRWDNPAFLEFTNKRTPLGRMGQPEEVVGAVVYFLSEEASWTTGTTLYVDGGWTAQ
jgi:NAD(P)-dependent dehydrogenase (short-subunit alcohol dehydrogenase family)